MNLYRGLGRLFLFGLVMAALAAATDAGKPANVTGYVLDSACAFTKSLKKPISPECATACAKAGSPLVILGDNGTIYWPIADTTPSSGQNQKLLPFAGRRVTASGKIFERGGSSALVIEKIELLGLGARAIQNCPPVRFHDFWPILGESVRESGACHMIGTTMPAQ
jgi:hypothetical protein